MIRPCRLFYLTHSRRRILSRHYHNSNERVVVALSGGVDSSIALGLMLAAAKNRDSLSAIYMSNWNLYDDDTVHCTTEVDWKDAQAVARHFHCPIRRVALEAEYWTCVFEPFLDGLSSQQMGNPDIACNTYIKFGALLENVKQRFGQDTVLATGHYARLWDPLQQTTPPPCLQHALEADSTGLMDWLVEQSMESNASILLAAADSSKDQSYFLSGCSGQALRDVRFPLGDLYKKGPGHNENSRTVRQLAMDWKVPVANKKDSTGICFVGKRRSFRDFLLQNQYLPPAQAPVDFVDIDTQKIVGTTAPENAHPVLFTSGQGAKISGSKTKYFVVGILTDGDTSDDNRHKVGVCAGTHHPALFANTLFIDNINWVTGCPPPQLRNGQSLHLKCRIRHLQPLQTCTLSCEDNDQYKIVFDLPLRGITSGQQAVLYDPSGVVCLGGGAISARGPSFFEMGLALPSQVAPSGHNDQSRFNCSA